MNYRFKIIIATLICTIAPGILFAFTVPAKPASYVADYASVLKADEKSALEAKLSNFEKQTTNEIAVVTIASLDGDTIENVAQDIFTKWGIGKKGENNGALVLISIGDRKTRIHTGYGLEGSLTDIGTSYIQSEIMRPAFQASDYAGGINGAVDKMISLVAGESSVPADYSPDSGNQKSGGDWLNIFFFGLIIFQWIFAILARSKSWWAGGVVGVVGGIIIGFIFTLVVGIIASVILGGIGLLLDYFVSKNYQKYKSQGRSIPWFIGGGGFGGRGGGGFGGFGGGMSGGGGSSGSW